MQLLELGQQFNILAGVVTVAAKLSNPGTLFLNVPSDFRNVPACHRKVLFDRGARHSA